MSIIFRIFVIIQFNKIGAIVSSILETYTCPNCGGNRWERPISKIEVCGILTRIPLGNARLQVTSEVVLVDTEDLNTVEYISQWDNLSCQDCGEPFSYDNLLEFQDLMEEKHNYEKA